MKEKKHNFGISPVMRVYKALVALANFEGVTVKQQAVDCIKTDLIRKGYIKQK